MQKEPIFSVRALGESYTLVQQDNAFQRILGIKPDELSAAAARCYFSDGLLQIVAYYTFVNMYSLKTPCGEFNCGVCVCVPYDSTTTPKPTRLQEDARYGSFSVIEAQNISPESKFFHCVDVASLMANIINHNAVFQIFDDCRIDDCSFQRDYMATLPASVLRRLRFMHEFVPQSLIYQTGVPVIYGQIVGDCIVCMPDEMQTVDLAVCRPFDLHDEDLVNNVRNTYLAVINAAIVAQRKQLFLKVFHPALVGIIADMLSENNEFILESCLDITLLWHSHGIEEELAGRNALCGCVDIMNGIYKQYRADGIWGLEFSSSSNLHASPEHRSPTTPMTPSIRSRIGRIASNRSLTRHHSGCSAGECDIPETPEDESDDTCRGGGGGGGGGSY